MYIKVKHDFFDKNNSLQLRQKGEIMEADKNRAAQLIALKMAEETDEPGRTQKKQTAT